MTKRSTKKQNLLVCKAFFEILNNQLSNLAFLCRNFGEVLAQSMSTKKNLDLKKITDAQRSEVLKAYVCSNVWAGFHQVLKVVSELLNDDIQFIRNELLDILSVFCSKGTENFVHPVLSLLVSKITTNEQKTFEKIAKIVDISINNKASLSLVVVKELHQILLSKLLKPEHRVQCFIVLSNIKFGQLEDQEVMHY